ncbi:UDP-N-acetylmuramate dehydrogenase [Patescibacteria group bacterium]|nr:UDP-N-acetylmuramate dehydrogenase [Patescibacteria group bacterium]
MNFLEEAEKLKINCRENELLKNYTTFKIGGPAKYFAVAKSREDLINLIKLARQHKISFFLLGGGSNILFSDQGFKGLVIKNEHQEIKIEDETIEVSSGYSLTDLLSQSIKHNLTGLEFTAGIPGTIGGAVVGNAGAYGKAISDLLIKIEVLDSNDEIKNLNKEDLNFSYRHSSLKENNDLLLKIYLKLNKGDTEQSLKEINKIIQDRNSKHPQEPSAGSIFKNVIITPEIINNLKKKNVPIPDKFYEFKKIPAGFLIEYLDLKGKKIGEAQISVKHGNYLINLGNAKAEEIIQLISFIKQQVRDKLSIQLEEEVRYIGF